MDNRFAPRGDPLTACLSPPATGAFDQPSVAPPVQPAMAIGNQPAVDPAGGEFGPQRTIAAMAQQDTVGPIPPDWNGVGPTSNSAPEFPSPTEHQPAGGEPGDESLLRRMWNRQVLNVRNDYRNYYSWPTAGYMLAGFGVAAGVANSDLDGEFQYWYQMKIRNAQADHLANFWMPFGEGQYTIPLAAGLALLNDTGWLDNTPVAHEIGVWGDRVARAYLVGAAPMLVMQEVTGGTRPNAEFPRSRWEPFANSHGVSGDAFMSSCLFISAADMSEPVVLKGFFYACSVMTPWERVNNNRHFLTQAALGWWMGYLACRAVNQTDLTERHVRLMPVITPEMAGVGLLIEH
jgi:hypothetical protein